jgi:sn1-specific diacylglycerol lipase
MPHFHYFGRSLHVGGDDFVVPGFCSIAARLVWIILIIIVYSVIGQHLNNCYDNGRIVQFYLITAIIIFSLSIFSILALVNVSVKGTMTHDEERQALGKYLTTTLIFEMFQFCSSIYGLIVLCARRIIPCDSSLVESRLATAFIILVIISQWIDSFVLLCCCYCVTKAEKEQVNHEEHHDELDVSNIWENRCRQITRILNLLLCNLFGGNNAEDGFEQVAQVFTTFFHHSGFLDVVPSDVVAGIILVRLQHQTNSEPLLITTSQLEDYREVVSHTISSRKNPVISTTLSSASSSSNIVEESLLVVPLKSPTVDTNILQHPLNNLTLQEIDDYSHCMLYALGIYSHLLALYMHPCTGSCRIGCYACCIPGRRTCCCCSPSTDTTTTTTTPSSSSSLRSYRVEEDNQCHFNEAGVALFLNYLRQQSTEIIYLSFRNDTSYKPFGIFLDHEKQWIIIAIRGTLSLEDGMTDVICEPEEVRILFLYLSFFIIN